MFYKMSNDKDETSQPSGVRALQPTSSLPFPGGELVEKSRWRNELEQSSRGRVQAGKQVVGERKGRKEAEGH